MADWRRQSIAGGLSPGTPNEDNPGALHLDFFYRPSAAPIAFPCGRAGGSGVGSSEDLGGVMIPGRRLIGEIADEAFVPHGADRNGGDRKMKVAPPATTGTALPPGQCQPVGTAPTGGCGAGGSRRGVKRPSSSPPPPLADNATETFVDIEGSDDEEAGEEEGEEYECTECGTLERLRDLIPCRDICSCLRCLQCHLESMFSEHGDDDDEEEEEESVCVECGAKEGLRKLIPCRHACYCLRCFVNSCRRNGPANRRCPVCRRKFTGAYY